MKNTDHDLPIGKTRAFHELENRGSETKQSRLETSLPPPLWQIPIETK
jgi:hypothetical protein